jgi:hypothetical protein
MDKSCPSIAVAVAGSDGSDGLCTQIGGLASTDAVAGAGASSSLLSSSLHGARIHAYLAMVRNFIGRYIGFLFSWYALLLTAGILAGIYVVVQVTKRYSKV